MRGATADHRPVSDVHDPGYAAIAADAAAGTAPRRGSGSWRGAGGRWLVWLGRAIIWVVVLLVGYNGVVAIVTRESASPPPARTASRSSGFPAGLASAYALQFAQVYLNASPATAARRASELAAFLPSGADPQLGWNGTGTMQLGFAQVAGVQSSDARHGVVTVLAQVNGHLMELGVPIYSDGRGLAVSGEPAWLAAPPRAAVPSSAETSSDSATQSVLMRQLPAFFQAYASGNQVTLARFLAPGSAITGLGGQVTFGSLTGLTVPPGGTSRHVTATVLWHLASSPAQAGQPASGPAAVEVTYALQVQQSNGTWYVKAINPATQTTGPP